MYGHRRGSGCILTAAIVASGKKRVFFPLVTIAASPLNFRRKQQQKKPSGTQGIRGHAVPGNFLDFNSLRSPFISWDPKSFKQDIGQFYSLIKPCNKVFSLLKIYLLCKIWPFSVKRWKPVWIRAWVTVFSRLFLFPGFKNDKLTSGESTNRLSGETTCYRSEIG